jgi:hypothetical protein
MRGLDPRIHLFRMMDCRVIGERSDAVLRTAMPDNDQEFQIFFDRNRPVLAGCFALLR